MTTTLDRLTAGTGALIVAGLILTGIPGEPPFTAIFAILGASAWLYLGLSWWLGPWLSAKVR